MSIDQWESLFSTWSHGPSPTEQERCDNAVRMIKDAINSYSGLAQREIKVFAQGSYRNRTNVRQDSDVDVCVLCEDTIYYVLGHAPGATKESLGLTAPATYDFADLKRDIKTALVQKFGNSAVTQGDKAFDVHETSYRIAADVVPAFVGRDYLPDGQGRYYYRKGTVLQSDKTKSLIYNWPEQNYNNGVSKHIATNRRFKKIVRIIKRMRNKLESEGIDVGASTSSYLFESVVHNCPNTCFSNYMLYDDVRQVIVSAWEKVSKEQQERSMLEVNEIKYLFHPNQPWTIDDTRICLHAIYNYIGFE